MSESTQTQSQSSGNSAAGANDPAIHIDVWFDVRCPWCFLGKRRLERGVELFHESDPDVPVTIAHHSFELAPGIPERFDGSEAEYLLKYEGVPLERSSKMLPALEEVAASEGVPICFADLKEVNTRRAHRVFQYGQKQGLGGELLERFFTAYFSEQADMADPETLAVLAADIGLDSDEDREAVLEAAESRELDEAVSADHVRGEMLGASGVPFALFNAKYRVPGAQSAEIVADALRKLMHLEFGGAGDSSE